ncbi:MAG: AsmA family protein [Gammaproteobacteria bacterium]|nr:AsmA family protein [Gammaproteobacteria bacterium]
MGRFTKIVVIFVAALAGLFAVGAIYFLLFFDPNDVRADIEKVVEETTGRELTIGGEVELQVIPWLAISVSDVTLGNAPGFDGGAFASFDRAELGVRFWPLLLRREITIGKAEIDGLQLNLAVNERDERNWSDLIASEEAAETDVAAAGGGGSFEMSGVAIRDATIAYVHQPKGDRYALTDVNLAVGRVATDGAAIPASGSLTFDAQPIGYSGDVELETSIRFDRDAGTVVFGDSSLDGVVSGLVDAPTKMAFATAGIEVDTVAKTASLQPVEISVLGLDISGELQPFSYGDDILPQASISIAAFSPRSLMTLFGVQPPETADPVALSRVIISADAAVRQKDVRLSNLEVKLDDTTFKGALAVPRDVTGAYSFDLVGDAIDLNRYMAPPGDTQSGADAAAAPLEIPAELVKPLHARGGMKFTSVVLGNLQLENVVLGLKASDGRMRINPVTAGLFGGTYSGNVLIDASGKTPLLSVDETVEGVDLAKLAVAMFEQENITGTITGNFKLAGRGNDMAEVQRTLGGSMSFELQDGTYEGMDIWYELRRARALLKKETPPEPALPARTPFSSVKATGVVKDGIMRNDDFVADLPFMQLTGNGSVNIPEATVDYRMRARVLRKPEAMGAATPEEIDDLTKTVIPIKITGPLASPKPVPDVEELLRERAEEELRDLVEDKLKDIFSR